MKKGDRILYGGEPGHIEFVADPNDPEADPHDWYIEEFGGGCMVVTESWGAIFIDADDPDEDLELVARGDAGS